MKECCVLFSFIFSFILIVVVLLNLYVLGVILFLEGYVLLVVDIDKCVRIEIIKIF